MYNKMVCDMRIFNKLKRHVGKICISLVILLISSSLLGCSALNSERPKGLIFVSEKAREKMIADNDVFITFNDVITKDYFSSKVNKDDADFNALKNILEDNKMKENSSLDVPIKNR